MENVESLIEAIPYINKFYGKTIVIKYGGNAMIDENLKQMVIKNIVLLKYVGINVIIVHGGGPDINKELENYNIKPSFKDGIRVTNLETMKIVKKVLIGKTNSDIVNIINKQGIKVIGISGIDGNFILCNQLNKELGYVGNIVNINCELIQNIIDIGYIPVISPIGVGKDGEIYNINADMVASKIATSIKAEKLIFLTDVDGVKMEDEVMSILDEKKIYDLIEKKVITGGMIPKVQSCLDCIKNGVKRVHIINGCKNNSLLLEMFTDNGVGTMIL